MIVRLLSQPAQGQICHLPASPVGVAQVPGFLADTVLPPNIREAGNQRLMPLPLSYLIPHCCPTNTIRSTPLSLCPLALLLVHSVHGATTLGVARNATTRLCTCSTAAQPAIKHIPKSSTHYNTLTGWTVKTNDFPASSLHITSLLPASIADY